MESAARLADDVADNSNNILGVTLGHAELALENIGPDEPLHAALTAIKNTAQRSADLTRQLPAFARKQTVAPKVVDLNETVESALKSCKGSSTKTSTWFGGQGAILIPSLSILRGRTRP